MKKRLLFLILPVITIVLLILPYGAVLNFGNPDGPPWRVTYSYFDPAPFAYANFAPLLTAICACLAFALLVAYCITDKYVIAKISKILLIVAAALSLCPLFYGIANFSVVGGFITATLLAEFFVVHFCVKRPLNA